MGWPKATAPPFTLTFSGGLPDGVLPQASTHYVAHDDLVHARRIHPVPVDGFADDYGTQFRCGKGARPPWNFPIAVRTALRITGCSMG
jgi:hypothetical protein